MAYDITSPLESLEVFSKINKFSNISIRIILSINNIADEFFELLNQKKMKYRKDDININLFKIDIISEILI